MTNKPSEPPLLKVIENDKPEKNPRPSGNRRWECRKCAAHFGTKSGTSMAIEVRTAFDITPRLTATRGEKGLICAYCFVRGEITRITR